MLTPSLWWLTKYFEVRYQDPKSILKEYAVFDETVWDVARKYFKNHKSVFGEIVLLPILNRERQLLCFAYQDGRANKEIRMLHELEEYGEVLSFSDIKTEYDGVTIHGCNELAWRMAEYLIRRSIPVNTEGELWKELRSEESYPILGYRNLEIWAEQGLRAAEQRKILHFGVIL